jgi:predicted membrane protein
VNGVGDLVASVMLGGLWTALSPTFAFACSFVLMVVGGAAMYRMGGVVPRHP